MDESQSEELTFSFVWPVNDDADRLEGAFEQLKAVADALGETYEIIFVNDGAAEATGDVLRTLARRDATVKYLEFSRPFGRAAALTAGLDRGWARAVIVLDDAGPAALEAIALMVEKWQAGAEVVYTAPQTDHGGVHAAGKGRLPARPQVVLLDGRAAAALRRLRGRAGCMGEFLEWIGFKRAAVPCEGQNTRSEPPNRLRAAAIGSLSRLSIQLVGYLGAALTLTGVIYLVVAGGLTILGRAEFSWAVTLVLTLSGVHLMSLAAVGSHVREAMRKDLARPMYLIRQAHGFTGDPTVMAVEPPVREATTASRFSVMT